MKSSGMEPKSGSARSTTRVVTLSASTSSPHGGIGEPRDAPHLVVGSQRLGDAVRNAPTGAGDENLFAAQHELPLRPYPSVRQAMAPRVMIVRMDADAMSPPAHPLFEQPWPDGEFRFFSSVTSSTMSSQQLLSWVRAFGIGPFHVLPVVGQQADYGGEMRTVQIQVAVAQAGPVQIELIQQHCHTPSIFSEWSRGGTSAFHQIATVTNDYDGKSRTLQGSWLHDRRGEPRRRFRVAYMDTSAEFGFYTEIVESSLDLSRRRCVPSPTPAPTGTALDPVRIMTRGGYRVPEGSSGR